MKKLWRRLRGALGIGLTWAIGWAPIGARAAGLPVLALAVAGAATVLGAGSAAASLALARRGEDRGLLEAGAPGTDRTVGPGSR